MIRDKKLGKIITEAIRENEGRIVYVPKAFLSPAFWYELEKKYGDQKNWELLE